MSVENDVPAGTPEYRPPADTRPASGLEVTVPPIRAGYLGPVNGGDPVLRCMRQLPETTVDESYRTQRLVWREGPVRHVLRPTIEPAGASAAHPWGEPVLVISAWNAGGAPRSLRGNVDAQARLVALVGVAGGQVLGRVAAVPADRGWAEESLVVAGLDPDQGRDLARSCGQEALLAWDAERLTALPTGDRVKGSSSAWVLSDEPVLCPMRTDDVPGARCRVHGGPWTSGAIHAAAVWQEHRAVLTRYLGCGVCADGTRPVDGPGGGRGAISIDALKIGSRHGGYVW
jgi:hypothetical protein